MMEELELTLEYIAETEDSTVSQMMEGKQHLCYVIEDGFHEPKIWGRTRIPAGRYRIVPHRVGRFYQAYHRRFGHRFVPLLEDVPNYEWILLHMGNSYRDTAGCPLPVSSYEYGSDGNYRGFDSRKAYLKVHAKIKQAFDAGQEVYLIVKRKPEPVPPSEKPAPPIEESPDTLSGLTDTVVVISEPKVTPVPKLEENAGCLWALRRLIKR